MQRSSQLNKCHTCGASKNNALNINIIQIITSILILFQIKISEGQIFNISYSFFIGLFHLISFFSVQSLNFRLHCNNHPEETKTQASHLSLPDLDIKDCQQKLEITKIRLDILSLNTVSQVESKAPCNAQGKETHTGFCI